MSFHILKGNVHDECIDAFEEYVQSYLDQGWHFGVTWWFSRMAVVSK